MPAADGATDAPIDAPCVCDDGLYCNGVETCRAGGACVPGVAPCTGTCDEALDACSTACPDADHDGDTALSCGGGDCDDANPRAHTGATEVCDVAGVDEDCDPSTFGVRDQDSDGFPDAACCNGTNCGIDCDDTLPAVHFGASETCDLLDDDCDGAIDEGVLHTYHPDADGDGYGDASGTPTSACSPPPGFVENVTDCDDTVGTGATIHPGATEDCARPGDENCDGAINEGCGCPMVGATRACGSPAALAGVGDCNPGVQICAAIGAGATQWGACTGSVEPAAERCGGGDEDCDGMANEGDAIGAITCYVDADGDGYHARGAASASACTCGAGTTSRDTPYDCDDAAATGATIHPGASETCNHVDDDCDTVPDRGVGSSCSFMRTFAGTMDAAAWSCSQREGTVARTDCSALPFTRMSRFPHLANETTTAASQAIVRLRSDVDLARDVLVSADFVLRRDTARAGSISVWLAPSGGAHAPTAHSVEAVGGAPSEQNALVASWDVTTRRVLLWRHDGTAWSVLAMGSVASSVCAIAPLSSASPVAHTLSLLVVGNVVQARLQCGSTTIESAATAIENLAAWSADYYDGPTYPRFHVGAGTASAGALQSSLSSFTFHRIPPSGAAGGYSACIPCRDYGIAGLSY